MRRESARHAAVALERGERLSLAEQASELREEQLALARSQAGFAQHDAERTAAARDRALAEATEEGALRRAHEAQLAPLHAKEKLSQQVCMALHKRALPLH